MKRRHNFFAAGILFSLAIAAYGAGPYTEEFHSSLRNWFTVNVLGNSGTWDWDSGTARLTFAPTGFPFDSTESSLAADETSSDEYFHGSYFVAGYPMIGFDFIFETAVPPLLRFDIYGATNYMSRGLLPDQGSVVTQRWYRAMIPLDPDNVQYWTFSSSSNDFADILDNVEQIAITIKRPGPLNEAHTARVDNIFLTSIPYAAAVSLAGGNMGVIWQPLREGARYRVETAESLPTGWASNSIFTATSTVVNLEFTPTTNISFIRLQADVIQER